MSQLLLYSKHIVNIVVQHNYYIIQRSSSDLSLNIIIVQYRINSVIHMVLKENIPYMGIHFTDQKSVL